jgi:hypothetical protein
MRVFVLIGIFLVAFGGLALSGRLTRTTSQEVVRIGEFRAEAQQRQPYPQWVGFASLAVGVGFIMIGARARKGG